MSDGWIGVDLDGTLAEYHVWDGGIGPPIKKMVDRVREWLAQGKEVRIVTARVSRPPCRDLANQINMILDWCVEHIGDELPITCSKDFGMIELWDDRVVAVERNTGRRMSPGESE